MIPVRCPVGFGKHLINPLRLEELFIVADVEFAQLLFHVASSVRALVAVYGARNQYLHAEICDVIDDLLISNGIFLILEVVIYPLDNVADYVARLAETL